MSYTIWEQARAKALRNTRMVPPWLVTAGDDGRSISASHVRSLRASGIQEWPTDAVAFVSRITRPTSGTAIYRTCDGGHRAILASIDGFPLIRIGIIDDDVSPTLLAQFSKLAHVACFFRPLNFLDKIISYISLCECVGMASGQNMKVYLPTQKDMFEFGACQRLGFKKASMRNLQELNRWARVIYFHRNALIPRLKRMSGSLSNKQSGKVLVKLFTAIKIPDKRLSFAEATERIEELGRSITGVTSLSDDSGDESIAELDNADSLSHSDVDLVSGPEIRVDPHGAQTIVKRTAAPDDEDGATNVVLSRQDTEETRSEDEEDSRAPKKASRRRELEENDLSTDDPPQEITPVRPSASKNTMKKKKRRKGGARKSGTGRIAQAAPATTEPAKRFFSFEIYHEYRKPFIRRLAEGPLPFQLACQEGKLLGLDVDWPRGVVALQEFRVGHIFPVHGRILEERIRPPADVNTCSLQGLSEIMVTRLELEVSKTCAAYYVKVLGPNHPNSDANVRFVDRTVDDEVISQEEAISAPGSLAQLLCGANGAVDLVAIQEIRTGTELFLASPLKSQHLQ